MRKKKSIPVKHFDDKFGAGIVIEKIFIDDLLALDKATIDDHEELGQTHRHDRHSFFFLERGTVSLEIDFKKYKNTIDHCSPPVLAGLSCKWYQISVSVSVSMEYGYSG